MDFKDTEQNNAYASAGNNTTGADASVHREDGQFNATASASFAGQTVSATVEHNGPKFGSMKNGFKNFPRTIVKTFKSPLGTAEEFFETATIADSIVMIGAVTVAYMLVGLILGIAATIALSVQNQAYGWFGDLFSYYSVGQAVAGWVFGGLYFPLLYMIISIGATFGLYALTNKLFIHKRMNIQKFASFLGAMGVGLLVCLALRLLGSLFGMIPGAGDVFNATFTIAYSVINLLIIVIGALNLRKVIEDTRSYVLTMIIGAAGMLIVRYVFVYVFSQGNSLFFAIL